MPDDEELELEELEVELLLELLEEEPLEFEDDEEDEEDEDAPDPLDELLPEELVPGVIPPLEHPCKANALAATKIKAIFFI